MANLNFGRSLLAGLAGTAVMTMLMLAAPLMGMPKMPIGEMLGSFLHIGAVAGWGVHLLIGLTLALIYAVVVAAFLPGAPALRGAIYGFVVFLVAQIVVTPMMGGSIFSGGDARMIMGSLVGHLVYGGLVGVIYGPVVKRSSSSTPRGCLPRRLRQQCSPVPAR
ncbi:MAG: hypothetical protein HYW06_13495 [Gemmatimonadetes bacterium]|nr:hypothetical protein [Gemmatimonadota bacterium]